MFHDFITKLIEIKQKNKSLKYIYAHNFSGFDGILLLKHLVKYKNSKVKPLIFNGKVISVTFEYKGPNDKKGITLIFKDSYLMLGFSLRMLCQSFKVDTLKSFFPFLLSDLNYSGEFPSIDLYSKIDKSDYDQVKLDWEKTNQKEWSFKEQSIKYWYIDCIALFEILVKFNELIFNHFKINKIKWKIFKFCVIWLEI